MATICGLLLSSLVLIILSIAGLGAILAASSTLFNIVKYVGAAYLIYLGIKMWRSRPNNPTEGPSSEPGPNSDKATVSTLIRTGFLVGISNPKDLLFFGALFPQFVATDASLMTQVMILTITWCSVAFIVMMGYAAIGSALTQRVNALNAKGILNRITGGVFVAAGGALAWAKRADA